MIRCFEAAEEGLEGRGGGGALGTKISDRGFPILDKPRWALSWGPGEASLEISRKWGHRTWRPGGCGEEGKEGFSEGLGFSSG